MTFLRAIPLLLIGSTGAPALEIVLDFTLDEQNYNWFDPASSDGRGRRDALISAAGFLSAIIRDEDWNALPSFNSSFTISDVSESVLNDLNGNPLAGEAETDGEGYTYSFPSSNRSTIAPNVLLVYVGAFHFDSGTTSHAIGGWGSHGDRNGAASGFTCWGGRIWLDLGSTWYWGSNPGFNPTNNYGIQDPDKKPASDITSDNWDWNTSLDEWTGFQLDTIDPSSSGKSDLYGVALHELLHVLGLTNTNFVNYIGVDANGDAIGANLIAEYGGPVPRSSSGGHFDYGTQSEVWNSDGIISEATLDPNTTFGRRKFLTRIDAAALRDLGFDVASSWSEVAPGHGLTITPGGSPPRLDWDATTSAENIVSWSTDLNTWTEIPVGAATTWTDPAAPGARRFYRVSD